MNRYSRCANERETNSNAQTNEKGHRTPSRARDVMSELRSAVLLHRGSYGRGCGVGRGLGVSAGLGVGEGLGVRVGVTVGVGVTVAVAVGVGVGEAVCAQYLPPVFEMVLGNDCGLRSRP
jgi:hypothetical protein